MRATQPRDPHFNSRLDDPIPAITAEQYASVTAQAARLARDARLSPAETIELVEMLGLDEAPFVKHVLTRRRPAPHPTSRTA
ncbi:hypothetical protein [Nocardioides ferulae]|uniref:hypothetical protein n=1 Tax=Nocardioides ferulae TaxID=2340821 RepID=UPI000EAF4497|nr:hypothetical protein [Nocardioides ferulae]